MKKKILLLQDKKSESKFWAGMLLLLIIQLAVVIWFGMQKQGYHYDEYYSYYSSNVTYALLPTDGAWKDTAEIRSEFMVLEDAQCDYGMVKLMQSLDVHPPLYYYLLHTVCGITKGIFSKWQGLAVNIFFFIASWLTLLGMTKELTGNDKKKMAAVCVLFGFSPAVFSGIMFIRMYMMLTFVCLLLLYIHCRAILKEQRSFWGFYLPVGVLSFVGFHIHYYFAVFLFFTAAAVSVSLFLHKESRKEAFLYAFSIVAGLGASVALYPACLGHIFRGYRGTEAQEAFFSLENIGQRFSFFFALTNEYVFGNTLVLLLLCLLLLVLTKRTKKAVLSMKRAALQTEAKEIEAKLEDEAKSTFGKRKPAWTPQKRAMGLILFVTLGYFCVVAKTALLNAEEAIRYEMPIYGLLILVICVLLLEYLEALFAEKNRKWSSGIFAVLIGIAFLGEVLALAQGKVCFLYPQDAKAVQWAAQHRDDAVVYIYNTTNQWMIWDESEELMQYEQIYFVSSENRQLHADLQLSSADTLYVYQMRGEACEQQLAHLLEMNGGFSKVSKIRELLYCDLYEIKR